MNYPIEGLTWIAPILFLVLMIGFPIIGVFGGWKRAVYWGGGNFLFYVIGLLIWTFAGNAIIEPIKPLIQQLFSQLGTTDLTNIVRSIVAPVFFIIVLFLANIILVINYYAWYKKVVGLSKYKTVKKKTKEGVVKMKVQNKVQLSTSGKVVNMVVGGIAMSALMLPTTFAFSEAVSMATTSYKTRQTNKFSSGVHNALVATDKKINWFSYYSGSAEDFDALFGTLNLMNDQVKLKLPGEGQEEFEGTALEALGRVMDEGLGEIFKWTTDEEGEYEIKGFPTKQDAILYSADQLAISWNALMSQASDNLIPLFNSGHATEIVRQIIGVSSGSDDTTLTSVTIQNYIGEDCTFAKTVEAFNGGSCTYIKDGQTYPMHQFEKIDVSQECYDNVANAVYSSYQFTDDVTEEQKQIFKDRMNQMMDLLFK